MKLKKIVSEQWVGIYLLIGVSALYFVYSLGFMSNFFRLFYDGDSKMFDFYKELQLLNRFIFNNSLTTLLLSILALPLELPKKKTGWINMIYLIGFILYELSNLGTVSGSVPYYTKQYMSFDFSGIDHYQTTPVVFTLEYVFYGSILLILFMILLAFLLRWKNSYRSSSNSRGINSSCSFDSSSGESSFNIENSESILNTQKERSTMLKGGKLLYQDNKSAYQLVLGFLLLNMTAAILILNGMDINIQIGVFIMLNIILSLVGFLMAAKVKKYSPGWAYAAIAIGILQLFRSFFLPEIEDDRKSLIIGLILLTSAGFVLAGGMITVKKAKIRLNYLKCRD